VPDVLVLAGSLRAASVIQALTRAARAATVIPRRQNRAQTGQLASAASQQPR
jgi:hypothetical protein